MATFLAWKRPGVHALTTGVDKARRVGAVQLDVKSIFGGVMPPSPVSLSFALFGAGDVSGLRLGAIRRRYPSPGVADAPQELAAHVEFAAPDLPWRYSPDEPTEIEEPTGIMNNRSMRPWLVLLAGPHEDLVLLGAHRVRVSSSVLKKAELKLSHQWAHVHQDDAGGKLARVLSPCTLPEGEVCRAVLVPAYQLGAGGNLVPAWAPGSPFIELPLYDTWTFTTAASDDFPQLAEKLAIVDATALGNEFGRTAVRLHNRETKMMASGALMRPADFPAIEAPPSVVDSDILESWPIAEAAGRWVLAPPAYDMPWRAGAVATVGWAMELLRDPRRRGGAGLGAWCAIDQQNQLADGARRQSGVIDMAAHDFRNLSLGLAAGASLFTRRLPKDSLERLAILGPMLRRLPSLQGGTGDRVLRDRTPRMHPALLSGAMRRTIRPGTALSASAPGLTIANVLAAANRCPDEEQPSPFTQAINAGASQPGESDLDAAISRWEFALGGFAQRAAEAGRMVFSTAVELAETNWRPSCNPVNLEGLGDRLASAINPSHVNAPAIVRVLGRYKGIADPFPSPVYEPELDLPLAPVLSRLAPQWLLPGRGKLESHRIVAMASNPRFVESALAGANHRALGELRWRNVRIRSGWSPLRRFWPRPKGPDVTPLREWIGDLADPSHRPTGDVGNLLVIVIRSPILRRYPGTAVYLLHPRVDVNLLHTTSSPPPAGDRIAPIFKGKLEPDLHYIGFPLTPDQAANHHLVFEEPMGEPRFRLEPPWGTDTPPKLNDNSAVYAEKTFHRRTIAVLQLL